MKGRLPNNGKIDWNFEDGVVTVTSPDHPKLLIEIDTSREFSDTHQPTSSVLEIEGQQQPAALEAKQDQDGVIRYDSLSVPEFWLEVRVKDLDSKKKRRIEPDADDQPDEPMPWSKMTPEEGAQLTLWPGILVKPDDLDDLVSFFKEQFDIEPTPVGCVKTLPDKDAEGNLVKGADGRCDFFFYVAGADVMKFAFKRLAFGMRWWEDVYFNDQQDMYPEDFRAAYPDPMARITQL